MLTINPMQGANYEIIIRPDRRLTIRQYTLWDRIDETTKYSKLTIEKSHISFENEDGRYIFTNSNNLWRFFMRERIEKGEG